jgi:predicted Rossmann-fold nucleotide-binding protein
MDELFEALTLIQTGKVRHFPVVLVGTSYWGGLLDWIRSTLLANGMISPGDVELLRITDDPDEAIQIIQAHAKHDQGRPPAAESDLR